MQSLQFSYNPYCIVLSPFKVGNHVVMQNNITKKWNKFGIIVEIEKSRDYLIMLPRFLRHHTLNLPPEGKGSNSSLVKPADGTITQSGRLFIGAPSPHLTSGESSEVELLNMSLRRRECCDYVLCDIHAARCTLTAHSRAVSLAPSCPPILSRHNTCQLTRGWCSKSARKA